MTDPGKKSGSSSDRPNAWDNPDGLGWRLWRRANSTGLAAGRIRKDAGRAFGTTLRDPAPLATAVHRRWGINQGAYAGLFSSDLPLYPSRPLFFSRRRPLGQQPGTARVIRRSDAVLPDHTPSGEFRLPAVDRPSAAKNRGYDTYRGGEPDGMPVRPGLNEYELDSINRMPFAFQGPEGFTGELSTAINSGSSPHRLHQGGINVLRASGAIFRGITEAGVGNRLRGNIYHRKEDGSSPSEVVYAEGKTHESGPVISRTTSATSDFIMTMPGDGAFERNPSASRPPLLSYGGRGRMSIAASTLREPLLVSTQAERSALNDRVDSLGTVYARTPFQPILSRTVTIYLDRKLDSWTSGDPKVETVSVYRNKSAGEPHGPDANHPAVLGRGVNHSETASLSSCSHLIPGSGEIGHPAGGFMHGKVFRTLTVASLPSAGRTGHQSILRKTSAQHSGDDSGILTGQFRVQKSGGPADPGMVFPRGKSYSNDSPIDRSEIRSGPVPIYRADESGHSPVESYAPTIGRVMEATPTESSILPFPSLIPGQRGYAAGGTDGRPSDDERPGIRLPDFGNKGPEMKGTGVFTGILRKGLSHRAASEVIDAGRGPVRLFPGTQASPSGSGVTYTGQGTPEPRQTGSFSGMVNTGIFRMPMPSVRPFPGRPSTPSGSDAICTGQGTPFPRHAGSFSGMVNTGISGMPVSSLKDGYTVVHRSVQRMPGERSKADVSGSSAIPAEITSLKQPGAFHEIHAARSAGPAKEMTGNLPVVYAMTSSNIPIKDKKAGMADFPLLAGYFIQRSSWSGGTAGIRGGQSVSVDKSGIPMSGDGITVPVTNQTRIDTGISDIRLCRIPVIPPAGSFNTGHSLIYRAVGGQGISTGLITSGSAGTDVINRTSDSANAFGLIRPTVGWNPVLNRGLSAKNGHLSDGIGGGSSSNITFSPPVTTASDPPGLLFLRRPKHDDQATRPIMRDAAHDMPLVYPTAMEGRGESPINHAIESHIIQTSRETVGNMIMPLGETGAAPATGTEATRKTESNAADSHKQANLDELAEKVWIKIVRKMTIEQERRGGARWISIT